MHWAGQSRKERPLSGRGLDGARRERVADSPQGKHPPIHLLAVLRLLGTTQLATPSGRLFQRLPRALLVGALCAGVLVGCGQSADDMLASAKDYLAKNDPNAASIQLKNALQKDGDIAEARYLLGTLNLEQGDIAGAVKELERAKALGYADSEIAPYLARAWVLAGEAERAVDTYGNTQLSDSEAMVRLLGALGDAHLARGERDRARERYESALALSDTDLLALVGMSRIGLFSGAFEDALISADKALAAHPEDGGAHAARADVLVALGRNDEAVAAFDAALKARPRMVVYHFALISLLLRDGKLDVAEQRLAAMSKVAPKDSSTLYLKAFVDFRRDRNGEAREAIEAVLRQTPENLPAQLLAGGIYLKLGEHVLAQRHLETVLARAPGQPLARRFMAASLLATGQPVRARELLQPVLASTDDASTMTLAGQVFLAAGDFDAASDYFARAVDANPEDAGARTRLAVARLSSGDEAGALADLEAATAMDSGAGQAEFALILTHLRRGEFDEAMRIQQQLESKQPDNPQTHNVKGGILMAKRDLPAARVAFERALQLRPDFLSAAVNLARIDLAENQRDQAFQRFERVIEANPRVTDAYLLLAELMMRSGVDGAQVLAVLERGAEANPTVLAPRLAMVRLHVQQRAYPRALALAQELVAANPNDPQAVMALAQAQFSGGDHQQAIASLNRVVRLQPDSAPPLVALADAQRAAGDRAGAAQSLRRALSHQADAIDAQQRLVSILVEDRNFGEALKVASTIQAQRPEQAIGLLFEGDIRAAANEWDAAAEAFRKALPFATAGDVAIKLHSALLRAGKADEAAREADAWLSAKPDDLVLRGYLAERALGERRYEDAERQYRTMVTLNPNNALVLNNLAWVAGELGRADALELAERAAALAPENAAVLDTLGSMQVKQGQSDKGLENLRKAVSIAPGEGALRLNLARALISLERSDDARSELDALLATAEAGSPLQREAQTLRDGLK